MDRTLNLMHITEKYLKSSPQSHILLMGLTSMMIFLHKQIKYSLNMDSVHVDKNGCGLITFGKVDHI